MKTSIFLFIITITTTLFAQFNDKLFSKKMYPLLRTDKYFSTIPLGDQNGDGYDDFWISDCASKMEYIFFGSNYIDSIPPISFHYPDQNSNSLGNGNRAAIDVNNDSQKDMVIVTAYDAGISNISRVYVYYGGNSIDTIPDLLFYTSYDGQYYGCRLFPIGDYNGNGKEDFITYSPNYPSNLNQVGILMFYEASSNFDTIPHAAIGGDPFTGKRYYNGIMSGDINGDGKSDFILRGKNYSDTTSFLEIYYGNSSFDLTPSQIFTWRESSYSRLTQYLQIVNDINRDGKDDLVDYNHSGLFPGCDAAIYFGGYPLDTIPDLGLNIGTTSSIEWVLSPGDVNGDGANDLLIKTSKFPIGDRIMLWMGGRNMKQIATKVWSRNDQLGLIGSVGDVNGDGTDDFVVGEGHSNCIYGIINIFKGDTTVIGDTTTSINEKTYPEEDYGLSAYPNPSSGIVKIEIDNINPKWVSLSVFNALGEEILCRTQVNGKTRKYTEEIDLSNYPAGVYIIQYSARGNSARETVYKTKKISLIK